MSDGELKRQLQQASSENFNNGRSENKKRPTATDYMTTLQSQLMYDSNNVVNYSEEQQVTEKSQDFSQQKSESKIVNRH